MISKRTLALFTAAVAAAVLTGLASAVPPSSHVTLLIRHQLRGCHTWSVNGGPFAASQTVLLRRGGWITVTNNDVMPHKLVETSGPAIQITNVKTSMMGMGLRGHFAPGTMAHMGATTKVTFSRAGVYRFTTKPGEDYIPGIKTIGEDNVLRLTVTVS